MLKTTTFILFITFFANARAANPNKAAVSWVLFDNRSDFVYADKKLHNRFLEDFGVPNENIEKLNPKSTQDAFLKGLTTALEKIKNSLAF